jgi:hypothetical protein
VPAVFQIEGKFWKGHWSSHAGAKLIIGSVYVEVKWEKDALLQPWGKGAVWAPIAPHCNGSMTRVAWVK